VPRVFLIDDEPLYHKMIARAIEPHGYVVGFAKSGIEGLAAIPKFNPDVIITDLRLPDLSGYEVAQRLRRDPVFNATPIIFLTSQTDLSDKLKAFEVGADDYLVKPFQPDELLARLGALARRSEAIRDAQKFEPRQKQASIIAVHSLRGGIGCSSMAVNLGSAIRELWLKSTLIMDSVLISGQVALMLNSPPTHTWADLDGIKASDMEEDLINSCINHHKSGLDYIASPPFPIGHENLSTEIVQVMMTSLKNKYEFIIIDTAHDLSDFTIHMLDKTDQILLLLAPEMASIRSAICALTVYDRLGFSPQKIKLVLNNIFADSGIKQNRIEKAINHPIDLVIPYAPNEFVKAINYGEPLVTTGLETQAVAFFEDTAFNLSNEEYKNITPLAPTQAWKHVNNRKLRLK
jgi:pilus assembly protein CpaE